MMEAATLGALEAGKPVAGIRIQREAGTKVRPGHTLIRCAAPLPSLWHASGRYCRHHAALSGPPLDSLDPAPGTGAHRLVSSAGLPSVLPLPVVAKGGACGFWWVGAALRCWLGNLRLVLCLQVHPAALSMGINMKLCVLASARPTSLPRSPGVRMKESDRTAFIFLPGGLGTMDGEGGGLHAVVGRGG